MHFLNGIMEGVSYEMDRPGHYIKTIEKGETEVKEPELFSEEKQSAGFEHFLSKL